MNKHRKKAVVIEAVQFSGSSTAAHAIRKWMEGGEYRKPGMATADMRSLIIPTLEGEHVARPGDWIIKDVEGEFYPVRSDIFEATYEAVPDSLIPDEVIEQMARIIGRWQHHSDVVDQMFRQRGRGGIADRWCDQAREVLDAADLGLVAYGWEQALAAARKRVEAELGRRPSGTEDQESRRQAYENGLLYAIDAISQDTGEGEINE